MGAVIVKKVGALAPAMPNVKSAKMVAVIAGELPPTLRDWESLSPEEQRRQARKMEIYAAMVEAMDLAVGKVLDKLDRVDVNGLAPC